jgi:hypothetical protein
MPRAEAIHSDSGASAMPAEIQRADGEPSASDGITNWVRENMADPAFNSAITQPNRP